MKKYSTISLFIFWTVIVVVITAGVVSLNRGGSQNQQAITGQTDNTSKTTSNPTTKTPVPVNQTNQTTQTAKTTLSLTSSELAKHNSSSSCWLLISGKIYDVTNFINQHPGGAAEILNSCGTDATVAFNTRGGTGTHSASADAMLAAYYIGNLNQTVITNSTNSNTPTIPAPNPTVPARLRGGENESDD